MKARSAALAEARAALASEERVTLQWLEDTPTIAFLATLTAPAVVIPLGPAITFVGRSAAHSKHRGWCEPVVVEGHQWFVRCEDRAAKVVDAASTNQSVIIRADSELPQDCSLQTILGMTGAGFVAIPHRLPQPLDTADWISLNDGDVLVTAYAAMVFGWLRRD